MRNDSREPKWLTDAARTMRQGPKESYGDEDQNDLMAEIDNGVHEFENDEDDFEPDWLKKAAKSMRRAPKESYGDEDQNDLMELIDEIRTE